MHAHRLAQLLTCATLSASASLVTNAQSVPDLVIKNATVMTASHGTIQHGSVWIHQGKIAGVGASVDAPASATVIDASGKYLTPGIIDPHSHSALDSDVNEATSPVTPSMMMIDAFDNRDKALYQALAGGVTTELLLHGSNGGGLFLDARDAGVPVAASRRDHACHCGHPGGGGVEEPARGYQGRAQDHCSRAAVRH